jgi:hypothetical protein
MAMFQPNEYHPSHHLEPLADGAAIAAERLWGSA